jgi:hypothetical protein
LHRQWDDPEFDGGNAQRTKSEGGEDRDLQPSAGASAQTQIDTWFATRARVECDHLLGACVLPPSTLGALKLARACLGEQYRASLCHLVTLSDTHLDLDAVEAYGMRVACILSVANDGTPIAVPSHAANAIATASVASARCFITTTLNGGSCITL